MWEFYLIILLLMVLIAYIDQKEGLALYDASENPILEKNEYIYTTNLFPNLNTKDNTTLIQMFSDISYCENIDDLSYVRFKDTYVMRDDYNLYNTYEGFMNEFETLPMDWIEKIYLLMVCVLFIVVLSMRTLL